MSVGARRKPSTSNTNPSGVSQGTPGGAGNARPRTPQVMLGDEAYLWVLVIIEVFLMGWLRSHFRRHHGG